jgi:hypothetical protein
MRQLASRTGIALALAAGLLVSVPVLTGCNSTAAPGQSGLVATQTTQAEAQAIAPATTETAVRALFTDPDPNLDTSSWLTGVKVDGATVSLYLSKEVSLLDYAHAMSNHVFTNLSAVKLVITYGADGNEIGRWTEYKYWK